MDGPGHQLFAGAGLPGEQHGAVAGRGPLDLVEHPPHGGTLADNKTQAQAAGCFRFRSDRLVFLGEVIPGLLHHRFQFLDPERLHQVVQGPEPDALHRPG